MGSGKKAAGANYLDLIPARAALAWSADEAGMVTLHKENTGLFDRAAQKLLRKPRVSHIHLDEMGSFVWPRIDGARTVGELAELAARVATGAAASDASDKASSLDEALRADIAQGLEAGEPANALAKRLAQKYSRRKREVYALILSMQQDLQ